MHPPRTQEPSQGRSPPGLPLALGHTSLRNQGRREVRTGSHWGEIMGGVQGPISLRALRGSPDHRPEEQKPLAPSTLLPSPQALPLVPGNAVYAVSQVLPAELRPAVG